MPLISLKRKVRKAKLEKKFKKVKLVRSYLDQLSKTTLLLLLGFTVFLFGGGLYNLVIHPPTVVSFAQRVFFFLPYHTDEQLLGESLIFMILLAMGSLGIFMVNRCVTHIYSRRLALIIFVGGIIMFVVSVVGVYMLLNLKIKLSPI